MAVITREDVIPSFIPNTEIQKVYLDGVHKRYYITACEGYVLHDKDLDEPEVDENFEPTGNIVLGFYAGTRTVNYNYDFTANPREFYAVLETELPANSEIFNIGNDHEIA